MILYLHTKFKGKRLKSIAPLKMTTPEDILLANFPNKIHKKYFSEYFGMAVFILKWNKAALQSCYVEKLFKWFLKISIRTIHF